MLLTTYLHVGHLPFGARALERQLAAAAAHRTLVLMLSHATERCGLTLVGKLTLDEER